MYDHLTAIGEMQGRNGNSSIPRPSPARSLSRPAAEYGMHGGTVTQSDQRTNTSYSRPESNFGEQGKGWTPSDDGWSPRPDQDQRAGKGAQDRALEAITKLVSQLHPVLYPQPRSVNVPVTITAIVTLAVTLTFILTLNLRPNRDLNHTSTSIESFRSRY